MRHSIVLLVLLATALCAQAAENPSRAPESAPPKRLNLRAPDITTLYTPEQIARILAASVDENIEGVQVEGERGKTIPATPEVWGAIAAPFWALLHPTQAWRIFLPLPPDRARDTTVPDATESFRESAAPIP